MFTLTGRIPILALSVQRTEGISSDSFIYIYLLSICKSVPQDKHANMLCVKK